MSFALGSWWNHEIYEGGLTWMSIITVVFAGALVWLMMVTMVRDRVVTGHDVASLTYVLSTMVLFFVIAARFVLSWPEWATFFVIALKTASVVAVTLWAYAARYHWTIGLGLRRRFMGAFRALIRRV